MEFLGGIFDPSSSEAREIINLSYIILGFTLAILALIVIAIAVIIIKFRKKPGDDSEPKQNFGSTKVEIIWTVIPLIVVVIIFFFTVKTMHAVDPRTGSREPDIVVIGHQWWWEFYYPQSGVLTANEVHIPVGKKLLLRLESNDVIHSFWIPELAGKIDVIPGHINHLWLESDSQGLYLGACAEFCGLQHGNMRLRVIAQTHEQFEAWQKEQLLVPRTPREQDALRGAELFRKKACMNCHGISGVSAARVGPNLTHISSRQTIGAGVLTNNPRNLKRWLINPQKFKPGSLMPDMKLSDSEAEDIVAYLETLK